MSRSTSSTDSAPSWPFIALGRVVGAHGVHGELLLDPAPGVDTEALLGVHVWFVPPPSGVRDGTVSSVRRSVKGPLVALDRLGAVSSAKALVGCTVLCATADLPSGALADIETVEPDVTGYRVDDERHGVLGEVTDVIHTKANDVWVVSGGFGEVLVPVIENVVLGIDHAKRAISVRLLPGLLPGEDEVV